MKGRKGKVPEALRLARRARIAENPLEVVTPAEMYEMCAHDGQLHNHAMREAGYLVNGTEPEDPCRTCGWSPGDQAARAALTDEEAAAAAERERLEAEADAALEAEAAELEQLQEAS